jgi:tungstate transport system substrate-binding protein
MRVLGSPSRRSFIVVLTVQLVALLLSACGGAATPTPAPKATVGTTPAAATAAPAQGAADVILATTTSTQDSGLLDVLVPAFEAQARYRIKTIAVGTGQALALGERGEADVLLVHAPDSERRFMEAGHGVSRRLVMHNDFVIVGPAADPAGIKGGTAADGLKKIAARGVPFISRGDNSGTHQLEQKLWQGTGLAPKGQSWYQEAGTGMGATLNIAAEKGGYTITDRGTYLSLRERLGLALLVEGERALLNIYSVITVNPKKSERINAAGGAAFADWIVSAPAQALIKEYGVAKYGQPLFFPDAGKDEATLGQ